MMQLIDPKAWATAEPFYDPPMKWESLASTTGLAAMVYKNKQGWTFEVIRYRDPSITIRGYPSTKDEAWRWARAIAATMETVGAQDGISNE